MLPNEFLINDVPVQNKQQIADAFNKFYVNIGPSLNRKNKENNSSPMEYMKSPNPNTILLSQVTDKEVKDIVLSLKVCSPGWDLINSKIIADSIFFYNPLSVGWSVGQSAGCSDGEAAVSFYDRFHDILPP